MSRERTEFSPLIGAKGGFVVHSRRNRLFLGPELAEIVAELGDRQLRTFTRDELQAFLDARSSLSFCTVDHLRWGLRQVFGMAVAEGIIVRNPAAMLQSGSRSMTRARISPTSSPSKAARPVSIS